jgi:serine/threonine protein phosphatase PrpC
MRLTFEIFSAPKKRIDRRGSLFTISADNSLNNRKIQRLNCGEDSFLRVKSKNIYAFGVFDGVGGCNEHGIDPTFMAWGIADGCKNFFRKNPESSPKSIMKRAYKLVKKTQRIWCATTACLLLFDGETNRLSSGIVGDSSYMIIHKGFQKYTMGCEKRLSFNYPRQYHINKEVKNTREIPSVKDFIP